MKTINPHLSNKTEKLTNAFRIFNELSLNLAESYQGLEQQITKLHSELAAVRSERMKTLIEKEKLASQLQRILAALPAAVLVLDVQGQVVDCNSLALKFLGDPLLGLEWPDIAARSLVPVLNNPHERQLHNGCRVNLSFNLLPDRAGQIVMLSDVSEMRKLQDMVSQQKHLSAMGEMVSSLAHQVRTPLSTAILYASHLQDPDIDNENRQRFSKRILERLHFLERQVSDMLIFAREGRMQMERFSLSDMLSKIAEAMVEYTTGNAINFEIINSSVIETLFGNKNALRGAIMNLLGNAVEALAGTGTLTLSVAQSDQQTLKLAITDDGPGINAVNKARIFEPFFTTRTNGTGLGLAVVDSVARAHGGYVECNSCPGKGTVFDLVLPCIQPESVPLSSDL